MKPTVVLLVSVLVLLAGCRSVHTQRFPGADLARYQRFWVEHRLNDDRHLDETIVAELQSLGRQATAGPLTMMPDDVQVVVSYSDEWAWDFRNYLIQLHIQFHTTRKDLPLAVGTYRQPSMFTKPPRDVVHAILTPLFRPQR